MINSKYNQMHSATNLYQNYKLLNRSSKWLVGIKQNNNYKLILIRSCRNINLKWINNCKLLIWNSIHSLQQVISQYKRNKVLISNSKE